MTHVFVVDDTTFKYHLEYMFAGTGAKDKQSTFLTIPQVQKFSSSTERNLVSMIADISRVRIGDNIIFYLQATKNHEGMFFGVFYAASDSFFDENDEKNYLKDRLYKGLSFRVLIEPKEVYPVGVTEHELLDNIEIWHDPHRLCWSLIYRKLKGNRGCTMIMDYEYENLLFLLRTKNKNLVLNNSGFTYDNYQSKIVNVDPVNYKGRQNSIDITDRLLNKALDNKAFECHLQAFIIQQLASNNSTMYGLFDIDSNFPIWLGNEVACGVGMQRIDILIIQEVDNHVKIIPIELKDEEPNLSVFDQINWYIQWIRQYVAPNYYAMGRHLEIIPYIVAKEHCSIEFLDTLKAYVPQCNRCFSILPCRYIEFKIDQNGIAFKQQH